MYKIQMTEKNNYLDYGNGSVWEFNTRDLVAEIERLNRPDKIEICWSVLDGKDTLKLAKRIGTLCKKLNYVVAHVDGKLYILRTKEGINNE